MIGRLFEKEKGIAQYILAIQGKKFFRVSSEESPRLGTYEWIPKEGFLVSFEEKPPSRKNNKFRYAWKIEVIRNKKKEVSLDEILS